MGAKYMRNIALGDIAHLNTGRVYPNRHEFHLQAQPLARRCSGRQRVWLWTPSCDFQRLTAV